MTSTCALIALYYYFPTVVVSRKKNTSESQFKWQYLVRILTVDVSEYIVEKKDTKPHD